MKLSHTYRWWDLPPCETSHGVRNINIRYNIETNIVDICWVNSMYYEIDYNDRGLVLKLLDAGANYHNTADIIIQFDEWFRVCSVISRTLIFRC